MNADYDLAVRDHMVDLLHLGSERAADRYAAEKLTTCLL